MCACSRCSSCLPGIQARSRRPPGQHPAGRSWGHPGARPCARAPVRACVRACAHACVRACVRVSGTEKAQRRARPHSSASAVSCWLAHILRHKPRTTLAVRAATRSVGSTCTPTHARTNSTHPRTHAHHKLSHMHPRARTHLDSLLSHPLSRVHPPPLLPSHSREMTCEVNDELSKRLVANTHVIL